MMMMMLKMLVLFCSYKHSTHVSEVIQLNGQLPALPVGNLLLQGSKCNKWQAMAATG
jgi:hypothetical protein